ncbi:tellurite resistance TerB family protein [Caenispirillum salinarum]|uniref:tellurite resistance TerB family protein n=1 Tax=Caenispirillum salinarum TaxID=859058 RepID=UPI00384DD3B7
MDVRRLMEGVLGSSGARDLEREARRMMGGGSGGPRPSGQGGGKGGSGFTGGMMGGALSGGLINMVMGSKKGRKMGGKALKYGGAALLAGLAYKAWSDWKGNRDPQEAAPARVGQGAGLDLVPPPASSGFTPDSDQDSAGADFRLALIRAMIAAAKCDGHIDRDEHARIQQQIAEQDLSAEEKGFLLDAFSEEPDAFAVARLARTPEQGAELYAASRLAIDPDVPAEHQYLERLAGALGLPRDLISHLDAKIEAARLELGREEA